MEVFKNETTTGLGPAIRKGKTVPEGAVNLAYTKAPALSPDKNIVVIDTSRIVEENANEGQPRKALYYANSLGVLEDENGNQIVEEEYPVVTDVFSVDEDYSYTPGSEYTDDFILPFVHVSRHFHIDFTGIVPEDNLYTYKTKNIKVIDENGREYSDEDGNPRYKIQLFLSSQFLTGSQAAYRVHAFVDAEENENLYLIYNKVEMRSDGTFKNQQINYKELINPQPFFEYRPEESEVADLANRNQKWYSTKPISMKEQALGLPRPAVDGFKVFVPKKAINDPRIFQLFRWRLSCSFKNTYNVIEKLDAPLVFVGVVVTNNDPTSAAPYALLNLERSNHNARGLRFMNPLWAGTDDAENQETAQYWYVNFDVVTNDDLKKFDLLIWAPTKPAFDFTPYAGKIDHFTRVLGKTLFIDTNSYTVPKGLAGISTTQGVSPATGSIASPGPSGSAKATEVKYNTTKDPLLTKTLGGYSLADWTATQGQSSPQEDPIHSLSYLQKVYKASGRCQYILQSSGWTPLVSAKDQQYISFGGYEEVTTIGKVTSFGQFQRPGGGATGFSANKVTITAPTIPPGSSFLKTEILASGMWSTPATHTVGINGPGITNSATGSGTVSGPGAVYYPGVGYASTSYLTTEQQGGTYTAVNNISPNQVIDGGLTVSSYYSTTTVVSTGGGGGFVDIDRYVTVKKATGNGNLIFSTFGHLYSSSALFNYETNVLANPNLGPKIADDPSYGTYVNSPVVAGAMRLLFNVVMLATDGEPLERFDVPGKFASEYILSTDWKTSWTINASDDALSDYEKSKYGFSYIPMDVATPTPVWQRKLDSKTCKQMIDALMTEEMRSRIEGTGREYRIEFTNSNVQGPLVLGDSSYVYAWTDAYTPKLVVPLDMGPFIIRESEVSGKYLPGQYTQRTYPPNAYAAQIRTTYIDTTTTGAATTTVVDPIAVNWTAIGGGTHTGGSGGATSNVELTLANHGEPGTVMSDTNPFLGVTVPKGLGLRWWQYNHGWKGYNESNSYVFMGHTSAYAIGSSGEVVKFIQEALNRFQFMGFFRTGAGLVVDGQYGQRTADAVKTFQMTYNAQDQTGRVSIDTWGLIGGQILRMGNFKGSVNSSDHTRFFDWPARGMNPASISDGNLSTHFSKISAIFGGPNSIYEGFFLWFDQAYKINKVSITPFLEGTTQTLQVQKVQVRNGLTDVAVLDNLTYRPSSGQKLDIPIGPAVGNNIVVVLTQDGPSGFGSARYIGLQDLSATAEITTGSTQVASISVVNTSGPISFTDTQLTNLMSAADYPVRANFNGSSGETIGNMNWFDVVVATGLQQKGDLTNFPNIPAHFGSDGKLYDNFTGRLAYYGPNGEPAGSWFPGQEVPAGNKLWQMPGGSWAHYTKGNWHYFEARPDNVPVGIPAATASISSDGLVVLTPTSIPVTHTYITGGTKVSTSHVGFGRRLPSPLEETSPYVFYSMNESGKVSPVPETGWVSKLEGLKLLCNANGAPVGFDPADAPSIIPDAANATERKYVSFALNTYGNDMPVVMGFYDKAKKEFILNGKGQGNYEMTYDEWMSRGPQNVYIGVVSTYEVDASMPIPLDKGSGMVPDRWVMPVYGLYRRPGSKITLESLPGGLRVDDVWPVPVRTGRFSRIVQLRPLVNSNPAVVTGPYTNYLNAYQDTNLQRGVTAYYDIPEANLGGWSTRFGPPNFDVYQEQPIILDDNLIQVRQPPILMVRLPTLYPSLADPVRPIFTVFKKNTPTDEWRALAWSDIRDYNASTGEIYLTTPMQYNDPSLFTVDYTTARRHYYFKGMPGKVLDLNPYPGYSRQYIGQPIYMYIVPEFVEDSSGNLIAASVKTRTINFTLSPSIFDPTKPEFDPLAIELGVVYMSTATDINQLVIMDTRRRGGGARDAFQSSQLATLEPESTTYWDINYGAGSSYQKGGFVVIRLPAELKDTFTESQIAEAVERNITAGVKYKLEDLQGNSWS